MGARMLFGVLVLLICLSAVPGEQGGEQAGDVAEVSGGSTSTVTEGTTGEVIVITGQSEGGTEVVTETREVVEVQYETSGVSGKRYVVEKKWLPVFCQLPDKRCNKPFIANITQPLTVNSANDCLLNCLQAWGCRGFLHDGQTSCWLYARRCDKGQIATNTSPAPGHTYYYRLNENEDKNKDCPPGGTCPNCPIGQEKIWKNEYCYKKDKKCNGQLLEYPDPTGYYEGPKKRPTLVECSRYCAHHPTCSGANWDLSTRICTLLIGERCDDNSVVDGPGAYYLRRRKFGEIQCDPEFTFLDTDMSQWSSRYCKAVGKDCPGGEIYAHPLGRTVEECLALCSRVVGCQSVVHWEDTKNRLRNGNPRQRCVPKFKRCEYEELVDANEGDVRTEYYRLKLDETCTHTRTVGKPPTDWEARFCTAPYECPGGNFANMPVVTADATECLTLCVEAVGCQSVLWVYGDGSNRCYLKDRRCQLEQLRTYSPPDTLVTDYQRLRAGEECPPNRAEDESQWSARFCYTPERECEGKEIALPVDKSNPMTWQECLTICVFQVGCRAVQYDNNGNCRMKAVNCDPEVLTVKPAENYYVRLHIQDVCVASVPPKQPECPKNSVAIDKGPGCPKSCLAMDDVTREAKCEIPENPGCHCNEGYAWDHVTETCIPKENCDCYDDDGTPHKLNVPWRSADCKTTWECVLNDKKEPFIQETTTPCPDNRHCQIVQSNPKCVCDLGYVPDPDNRSGPCVPSIVCPDNSVFNSKASACQATCADREPAQCSDTNADCECNKACYVWPDASHDSACIHASECGCGTVDSAIRSKGDTWLRVSESGSCYKMVCDLKTDTDCYSSVFAADEVCTGEFEHCVDTGSGPRCECIAGYHADGGKCVPDTTCPENSSLVTTTNCQPNCAATAPSMCPPEQKHCACDQPCHIFESSTSNRCVPADDCGCGVQDKYFRPTGATWIRVVDGSCMKYECKRSMEAGNCLSKQELVGETCNGPHQYCDTTGDGDPVCTCQEGYHPDDNGDCVEDVTCPSSSVYDPRSTDCQEDCSGKPENCSPEQKTCKCVNSCDVWDSNSKSCVPVSSCGCGFIEGKHRATGETWKAANSNDKYCTEYTCKARMNAPDDCRSQAAPGDSVCKGEYQFCDTSGTTGDNVCACEDGYTYDEDKAACVPGTDCTTVANSVYDPNAKTCQRQCGNESPTTCSEKQMHCRCPGSCDYFDPATESCVPASKCGCGVVDGSERDTGDEWIRHVGSGACVKYKCNAVMQPGNCPSTPESMGPTCTDPYFECDTSGTDDPKCKCIEGYSLNAAGECAPDVDCASVTGKTTYTPSSTTCQADCNSPTPDECSDKQKKCKCDQACHVFDSSDDSCKPASTCGCGVVDGVLRNTNDVWLRAVGDGCRRIKCTGQMNTEDCISKETDEGAVCNGENEHCDTSADNNPVCACDTGYTRDPDTNLCEPAVVCPTGTTYDPSASGCQSNCEDQNAETCSEIQRYCVCDGGCYVYSSGDVNTCVPANQCGCGVVDGAQRKTGDEWKRDKGKGTGGKQMCATYKCTDQMSTETCFSSVDFGGPTCSGSNEICVTGSGDPVCGCEDGYAWNGDACEPVTPDYECPTGSTYRPDSDRCHGRCHENEPSTCNEQQRKCECDKPCHVWAGADKNWCVPDTECGCMVNGKVRPFDSNWIAEKSDSPTGCVNMVCTRTANQCGVEEVSTSPVCGETHEVCHTSGDGDPACTCESGYHYPPLPEKQVCEPDTTCLSSSTYRPEHEVCFPQCFGETSCSSSHKVCECKGECMVWSDTSPAATCIHQRDCGCKLDNGQIKGLNEEWIATVNGACRIMKCLPQGKCGAAAQDTGPACGLDNQECDQIGEEPECKCQESYTLVGDKCEPDTNCPTGTVFDPSGSGCSDRCGSDHLEKCLPSQKFCRCEQTCFVFQSWGNDLCVEASRCGCGLIDGKHRNTDDVWIRQVEGTCRKFKCQRHMNGPGDCFSAEADIGQACRDDQVCDAEGPGEPFCRCREGYEEENGACVPDYDCPANSEFVAVPTTCHERCHASNPPVACSLAQKKCKCNDCYVWKSETENECVHKKYCGCFANEKQRQLGSFWISHVGNDDCKLMSCRHEGSECDASVKEFPQQCLAEDNMYCDHSVDGDPVCKCKDGYSRDQDGNCVEDHDCPVTATYHPTHETCFESCGAPAKCNHMQEHCECNGDCMVWVNPLENTCVHKRTCGCTVDGIHRNYQDTWIKHAGDGVCVRATCIQNDGCHAEEVVNGPACNGENEICDVSGSGDPVCKCTSGYSYQNGICQPDVVCPLQSKYIPDSSTCQPKCGSGPCTTRQNVCQCSEDCHVWKNGAENTCVHESLCGCTDDNGQHRQLGDTWIKDAGEGKCKRMTCSHEDGCAATVNEVNDACEGEHQYCDTSGPGEPVCECKDGYEFNADGECKPKVTCPPSSTYIPNPLVCQPKCFKEGHSECNLVQRHCRCSESCQVWSAQENRCVNAAECGCQDGRILRKLGETWRKAESNSCAEVICDVSSECYAEVQEVRKICDGDNEHCSFTDIVQPHCHCDDGYHYDSSGDCVPDVTCPSNSVYDPKPKGCNERCHPNNADVCSHKQSACSCSDPCHVWKGPEENICVPKSQCGCKVGDVVYSLGDEWTQSADGTCQRMRCDAEDDCSASPTVINENVCDGPFKYCDGSDPLRPACKCREGYTLMNDECQPDITCPFESTYKPTSDECHDRCFARGDARASPPECSSTQQYCGCNGDCMVWKSAVDHTCVHASQCGCGVVNGINRPLNAEWNAAVDGSCSKYRCEEKDCGADVVELEPVCTGDHQYCDRSGDGDPVCKCDDGYSEQSGTCVPVQDCPYPATFLPKSEVCQKRCHDSTPSVCPDIQQHCDCGKCMVWSGPNDNVCIDEAQCGCMDGDRRVKLDDGYIVASDDNTCRMRRCRANSEGCGASIQSEETVCTGENEICDRSGNGDPFCRCADGYHETNGECVPDHDCPSGSVYYPVASECKDRCFARGDSRPSKCTTTQQHCGCDGDCMVWRSAEDHTCVSASDCGCKDERGVIRELNSEWNADVNGKCKRYRCQKATCGAEPVELSDICAKPNQRCVRRKDADPVCGCDEGYSEDQSGNCIPDVTCPSESSYVPESKSCFPRCFNYEPSVCTEEQNHCECDHECSVWNGVGDNTCVHRKYCGCNHNGVIRKFDEEWIGSSGDSCVWFKCTHVSGCDSIAIIDRDACTKPNEHCDQSVNGDPVCTCDEGYHEDNENNCVPDVECSIDATYHPTVRVCHERCFESKPRVCSDTQLFCTCDSSPCQVFKDDDSNTCTHAKHCGCKRDGKIRKLDEEWTESRGNGCIKVQCVHTTGCYAEIVKGDSICTGDNEECVQSPEDGSQPYCTCKFGYHYEGDSCVPDITCPDGTIYDPYGKDCGKNCGGEKPIDCTDEQRKCRCTEDCYIFQGENADICIPAHQCGCGVVDGEERAFMDTWVRTIGTRCYNAICTTVEGSCYAGDHSLEEICTKDHETCVTGANGPECDCKHGYFYDADGLCVPSCPEGEHFEHDAKDCDDTCLLPDAADTCAKSAEGRCVCDDDLQRDEDGHCVAAEVCGCYDSKGNHHEVGGFELGNDCATKCECVVVDNRPRWQCSEYKCPANSYCCQEEGELAQCNCQDGYYKHDDGNCYEDCPDEIKMGEIAIVVPAGSRIVLPMTPEGDCMANSSFNHQATACASTCHSPHNDANCPHTAEPGCECVDDHLFDHILGRCIPHNECGCYDLKERVHKVGSSWLSDDCSVLFMCQVGKWGPKVESLPYEKCPENSSCKIGENGGFCECNENFSKESDGSCLPVV